MKIYLSLLTCFIAAFVAPCFARTVTVGKGKAFTSIHTALAAVHGGDTLIVENGIYKEKNIVIDKSIVLKGINHPVLDGENKYEVLSIKAGNVVVDGFRVIHSGHSDMTDIAGIKIYNSKNVTVVNNILEDCFFGIYTQFGTNCTIKNNTIAANRTTEFESGNGIHCWKSDSMKIIANHIERHRDGIYFEFVTNSLIWKNTSTKNIRYGLHFMFSHNNAYISNIFRNNGAGVAVMYTHGVKMLNNYFEDNWGESAYGLLLKEISGSYIEGNHFLNNTIGINMEGCSRIQLKKNLFRQNGWALKIQSSCDSNILQYNNFIGNTFDIGTNGSLVLNNFDHNYWSKYEGYDLNKDKTGDIPYRPVSIYSMIVETNPPAMMLFRSFMVSLLDKTEKLLPSVTPDLKDNYPLMYPLPL